MEPTPSAATEPHRHKHHHHRRRREDPTCAPSSTVENISHRFSKLYLNHKKLVADPSEVESPAALHLDPHPQPDPHFQAKSISSPPISYTRLTKSNSHHERESRFKEDSAVVKFVEKEGCFSIRTQVKDKVEIKKPSSKKSSFDVKKAPQLMLKNLECEKVKRFPQGFKVIRRPSVPSINPPKGDNGGIKKSFCSPQVELGDFFSCCGVKVVAVDMPPLMQIHAVDCARKAHDSLEKFNSKTLALTLKKEFDGAYGAAWHCIVGSSFGSFVTHSVGGFMYFSLDHKLYILLFKTSVQRAQSN